MTSNDNKTDQGYVSYDDIEDTSSENNNQVDLDTLETEDSSDGSTENSTDEQEQAESTDNKDSTEELPTEKARLLRKYSKMTPEERAEKIRNGLDQKGVKNRETQYENATWLAEQFDEEIETDTQNIEIDDDKIAELVKSQAKQELERMLEERGLTEFIEQQEADKEEKRLISNVEKYSKSLGMEVDTSKLINNKKFIRLLSKTDSLVDALIEYKDQHYKPPKKNSLDKVSSVKGTQGKQAKKRTGYVDYSSL